MTVVLGDALIRARLDTSSLNGDFRGIGSQVGGAVQGSGTKVGHLFGNALKIGALGVTAAAGGFLGAALTKGFSRLNAIDQAKAKLEGLGHSTQAVNAIMTNALASVKGTAFGLDEAATVAASSVAAGIKPGQQLTKTLKLVADAATIGGTSMSDMGAIFNKVATSNKVQGDVINQLNDAGIPIVQLLGKSMHKTSGQVLALSQAGKIGFADFSKAMQEGVGGAALKSGNTFTGAYKNLMASVSRIGAGLLGGIFPHLAPALSSITKAMAPLETSAGAVGDKIGKVLAPAFARIGPILSKLPAYIAGIDFSHIGTGAGPISQIAGSLKKVGAALSGVDWSAFSASLGQGAADSISVFAVAIGVAANHIGLLTQVMPALIVAFAAYKTVQAASNVLAVANIPLHYAQVASTLVLASSNRALAAQMAITNGVQEEGAVASRLSAISTLAQAVASRVAAGAAKVWAAGQWLLNAALTANPIGLVVVAIAGLAAAFLIAYKHSATFRAIVTGAFNAVKAAASAAVGVVKRVVPAAFAFVVGAVRGYVAVYRTVVVAAFNAARAVVSTTVAVIRRVTTVAFNAVRTIVGTVTAFVRSKVTSGFQAARAAATSAVNAMRAAVSSALSKIRSLFTSAMAAVRAAVSNGMSKAAAAMSAGIGKIVSLAKGLGGKIVSAVSGLAGRMYAAGAALIGGLVRGITAKMGAAVQAVRNGLHKIAGLLPGSPIKWGPLKSWNNGGAGKKLMNTVISGVSSRTGALAAAARSSMAPLATAAPTPALPGVGGTSGRALAVRGTAAASANDTAGITAALDRLRLQPTVHVDQIVTRDDKAAAYALRVEQQKAYALMGS